MGGARVLQPFWTGVLHRQIRPKPVRLHLVLTGRLTTLNTQAAGGISGNCIRDKLNHLGPVALNYSVQIWAKAFTLPRLKNHQDKKPEALFPQAFTQVNSFMIPVNLVSFHKHLLHISLSFQLNSWACVNLYFTSLQHFDIFILNSFLKSCVKYVKYNETCYYKQLPFI